ncbi:amidase [Pseudooceanicola lipolyticus]|uniref:Amidase n=1 Tax=Pseudooceanicola lipolyticus TaxID=2029104 RepID=A0A2M8J7I4_9RHOB|nr:amidase [Pseudooceanicola lipolyticus]PJE38724.1 amidase [Pseudooceanicola lipolyticus]
MSDLWSWSASRLATAIAAGDITSVEATTSALARMDAANPTINAVVDPMPDEALEAARAADQARSQGRTLGPLHGVPLTIKINVDYAGRATTNGVVAYKDLIADQDGSVVRNLKASGAVIIGRTNTPCFSMRAFTNNDLHGATRNPHDARLTPGGSSGGAGAAVAVGIGAVAHGNDIGGSVRYPAYCNGVYGLRPTLGLAPAFSGTAPERKIVSQLSAVQGPLARTVEDIRLSMEALCGYDPREVMQVPAGRLFDPLTGAPCRVAMLAETAECPADTEVSAAIRQAGAMLRDGGYEVVETPPPSFQELVEYWHLILGNEMRAGLGPLMETHGDSKMKAALALLLEDVPDLSDRDSFLAEFARRSTLLRQWQVFFQEYPLVLTATNWAKPYVDDYDVSPGADGDWFRRTCAPMTGTPIIGLPGISVPVGTRPGAPMGVQLLANRFGDRLLLEAAAVLERAMGPIAPFDPIPQAESEPA